MRINKLIEVIGLILFSAWTIRLYYKIFDKKIRKYTNHIGGLMILLLSLRALRDYWIKDSSIIWYLYYIPLLFMPSLYYLCSRYIANKKNKITKWCVYGISSILTILVLTNDIHGIVFDIQESTKSYSHRIGYFIILIWILALLFAATYNLVIQRRKYNKDKKYLLAFIPIIIGIIYTTLYVINLFDIRRITDMSSVIGLLFFIGIEITLKLDLVPNNIEYAQIFKDSFLNIGIVSKNGEILYLSQSKINIPNEIITDIKNNCVKQEYTNINNENQIYVVQNIKNNYSILKKDYSNIENIKKELKNTNEELKKQEKLLKNKKKIEDKLYELNMNKEIMQRLEQKIDSKRKKINEIIDNMNEPDIGKIQEVKFLVSYCKRMSNLIISNYNNETYSKDSLMLIIKELLEDSKIWNITGVVNLKNNLNITSTDVSDIYEILFNVFDNIRDISVLINIDEKTIRILIAKKDLELDAIIQEKLQELNFKLERINEENGTMLMITRNK